MIRVIIFGRVSTESQDYNYQITSLHEYADRMNYNVVKVITEKASGLKSNEERKSLQELLNYIKANNIDKILITEISRLSRSLKNLNFLVDTITEQGVSIYIQNFNIETLDSSKQPNPFTQLMLSLLIQFSQIEVQNLKKRISMGKANSRNRSGRKYGYRKPDELFLEENRDAVKLLKRGLKIREVAKLTDRSLMTIQKLKHKLAA